MVDADMQRIQDIVQRVLREKGEAALTGWQPTALDHLQAELYNTLMRECPELDSQIHPMVRMAIRMNDSDPLDVQVVMERVQEIGRFNVKL